jgi:hypothetical protein
MFRINKYFIVFEKIRYISLVFIFEIFTILNVNQSDITDILIFGGIIYTNTGSPFMYIKEGDSYTFTAINDYWAVTSSYIMP